MDVAIVTLRLAATPPGLPQFDPAPLCEALRGRVAARIDHHLHDVSGEPALTFVVQLEPGEAASEPPRRKRVDWDKQLPEDCVPLFAALRDWRNDQARSEGVNRFMVLSNRELADIAILRPRSPEDLSTVRGIGPAKLERYGESLLALVAACASEVSA